VINLSTGTNLTFGSIAKGHIRYWWAGSRTARGEKTVSDIHYCLNYYEILLRDYTQVTHVAAGSGLETHKGKVKGKINNNNNNNNVKVSPP
jgi:hypothetical protein